MSMQAVTEAMESLNDLYLEMIDLGGQKREFIVHNDVDGLSRVMNRESKLMKRSTEVEQERLMAVAGYLKEKNLRLPSSITMTELTRVVFNLEDKERLAITHNQLLETIVKMKEINELNQQLIEQSLDFIDLSLDLLTGPVYDSPVYSRPNQTLNESNRYAFFDRKA
ncbi:hypothetical protein SY83_10970 [Paenibacillus swuensis]|uniref:Flagellar biosynthesis protein FlgN n=1 Tax=Paenibacillus swuensis TaxID=1178515 RepID=A0A172TIL9_9BACL|nr:flagellar protein FlgN [Paenibacillus swuensis]ANE46707.1 hypothetical protein SY83_10970 [Paenibacillus swuensis]